MKRGRKSSTRKANKDEEQEEAPQKHQKVAPVDNPEAEHALEASPPSSAKKGRRGSAKTTASDKEGEASPAKAPKQDQEERNIAPSENAPVLDSVAPAASTVESSNNHIMCPYLDTIKRNLLDFDFEKKCSISLQTTNVYCCLVCGIYFQGRTPNTYAYMHSIDFDHHVFVNMHNKRIYCLPDDYEVFDASLNDIKMNVSPVLSENELASIDAVEHTARTLDNRNVVCGVLALNNLHAGDAASAILQCLTHLPKLRDYLLQESNYLNDDRPASNLLSQLGILTRRIWNISPWRGTVSPHEFLQEASVRSEKKFGVGVKCDPLELYSWLMNTLHRDLVTDAKRRGVKNASSTLISQLFQGTIQITTDKVRRKPAVESNSMDVDDTPGSTSDANGGGASSSTASPAPGTISEATTKVTPFFFLQLDLPTVTLLKDEKMKTTSQQVPIYSLLSKYDGKTAQFLTATKENRVFKILTLPHYLVFFIKRFTQNLYLVEKNKTIVNFPVDELDMAEYVGEKATGNTKYALRAYICQTGDTVTGSCLSRFYHRANGKWYNSQDAQVEVMLAEDHFVAEAYMLFYERCS